MKIRGNALDTEMMEAGEASRTSNSIKFWNMQNLIQKYPRTFYVTFGVIFPMMFLNAVCFVCGHFLAKIEMRGEVESNDAYLRKIFSENALEATDNAMARRAFRNLTDMCFHMYETSESTSKSSSNISISHLNGTDMQMFLNDCIKENLDDIVTHEDPIDLLLTDQNSTGDLTYNWMQCSPVENDIKSASINLSLRSKSSAIVSFNESFTKIRDVLMFVHSDDLKAKEFQEDLFENLKGVSGHDNCHVHNAAGAFFWFTIMTTIGYGNAVPQTESGRAMVFTLGFLSILLFGVINGQAGYVALSISDDFFRKHNLNFLTKGMRASIFWLLAYALWNLVIAGMVAGWAYYRSGVDVGFVELEHAYWFAYISTTTVGFGDFYFKHEVINGSDLMYVPMVLLMGFVFLANFLIKFVEWISELALHYYSIINVAGLHELLEKQPVSQTKMNQNSLS